MMKSKAIGLALLALVFQAQAVPVTQSQAALAVRGWARHGRILGVRLGNQVEKVSELKTDSGRSVYAVKLKSGGTVFTSSDTTEPLVLAFTQQPGDFSKLDRSGPLWALLNQKHAAAPAPLGSMQSVRQLRHDAQWNLSISAGEAASLEARSPKMLFAPYEQDPSDLRVPPLLKSKWAQGNTDDGKACWNWFTPNGADPSGFEEGSPDNVVCGCVATAMAQVMRCLQYPAAPGDLPKGMTCAWDGTPLKLELKGESYDWSDEAMPLDPNGAGELTDDQRAAIGTITHDAGVSVGMTYNEGGGGESGAYSHNVAGALKTVFGFGNATFYYEGDNKVIGGSFGEETRLALLEKAFFANFDAGLPVIVGLDGHEIVADGYGFDDSFGRTDYVHLNMGWALDEYDVWYNLPELGSAGYTEVKDLTYNLFTEADDKHAVISGRVLDRSGQPAEGASVRIFKFGGTEPVVTVKTSARGIWSAILPAETYSVEAELATETGVEIAEIPEVGLRAPKTKGMRFANAFYADEEKKTIPVVYSREPNNVGNSWGNDMGLGDPTVRIVRGDVTNLYLRLEKALAGAEADDVVELLAPTLLNESVTVDRSLTVVAAGDDPYAAPILPQGGAAIVVTDGVVAFTNVAFSGAVTPPVRVQDAGVVAVSGVAAFDDIGSGVAGIELGGAENFRIDGVLLNGIRLGCVAAEGEAFGTYACDAEVAARAAEKLVPADVSLPLAGSVDEASGTLVWAAAKSVDPAVAVAYVDGKGVSENQYFRSLDELLDWRELADDARIVVTKDNVRMDAARLLPPGAAYEIVAESSGLTLDVAGGAGFVIGEGSELTVSGFAFADYRGNALFLVDGGRLAVEGCVFDGIEGTNVWSGAIAVKSGEASVTDTELTGCRATGQYRVGRQVTSCGGALYVGAGATLALTDVTVADCWANGHGGGVFVVANGELSVSGTVCVEENSSDNDAADDVFLSDAGATAFVVRDLDVASKIGVLHAAKIAGDGLGDAFVRVEGSSSAPTEAFVNDRNEMLVAAVSEDGSSLAWAEAPVMTQGLLPEDEWDGPNAYARLTVGGQESQWIGVQFALEYLAESGAEEATVELLKDDCLMDDVVLSGSVTLTSKGGDRTLYRDYGSCVTVGPGSDLTVTGVTLNGSWFGVTDELTVGSAPFVRVSGGAMTLDAATIEQVTGDGSRDAGAVSVSNDGVFTMQNGAVIANCVNLDEGVGLPTSGAGAAILADHATLNLLGGVISDCQAMRAAVFAANGSQVVVAGDLQLENNVNIDGTPCNLLVSDLESSLTLKSELTGAVGCLEGMNGDTNEFGRVDDGFADKAKMIASAHRFRHESNDDIGMVVSNGGTNLLVWSSAVAADGSFVSAKDGSTYQLLTGGEYEIAVPAAVAGLEYDGSEKTGVLPGIGYDLSGDVTGTNAGDYVASATLRPGFVWEGGKTGAQEVKWSIAQAEYDMDGIHFDDAVFTYDQLEHFIYFSGALPVSTLVWEYFGNGQTEVGEYDVTLKFTGDTENYKPIDRIWEAKLTIVKQDSPKPVPVVDFAFTDISRQADGSCLLTISPVKRYCKYTLQTSTDLKTWTSVGEPVEAPSDGELAFPPVSSEQAQRFWQVVGEDGVEPAE